MSKRTREGQASLTIRDRIDFTYLLEEQIITFQQATLNTDFSRREIEEAIDGFVSMVPKTWQDEDYQSELKEAIKIIKVDIRPTFATIPLKMEICKEKNIPIFQEREQKHYFKMLNCVINLLDRRGMISRKEFLEKATGMPIGETELPEGMTLQEYLESLDEAVESIKEEDEDEA